jgi:superfamily II DNA helicase RecQ
VQWKLPASVSTFVQRAGRAGRGPGREGLAVLLAEKSVYEADLSRLESFEGTKTKTKSKGVRQSSTYPKATKQYAISHGLLRGAYGGGDCDQIIANDEVPLDRDSMDEGLYTLVQTGKCRRKVLTAVYKNANPCKFPLKVHYMNLYSQHVSSNCSMLRPLRSKPLRPRATWTSRFITPKPKPENGQGQ